MSIEKITEPAFNLKKRLPDDRVSLIELEDGSRAIILKIIDQIDVKERCACLESIKKSSFTSEWREHNRLPPSTYNIIPQDATIKITGDLDELEDAADVLQRCHNYISPQKMDAIIHEISNLRFKAWEKERENKQKAKRTQKEERIRRKYGPLLEKFGIDKETAYNSLSNKPSAKTTTQRKTQTALAASNNTTKK